MARAHDIVAVGPISSLIEGGMLFMALATLITVQSVFPTQAEFFTSIPESIYNWAPASTIYRDFAVLSPELYSASYIGDIAFCFVVFLVALIQCRPILMFTFNFYDYEIEEMRRDAMAEFCDKRNV